MSVQLGDEVPDFTAESTQGTIHFHGLDWGRLGRTVLAPQGLHSGLHDRAWVRRRPSA